MAFIGAANWNQMFNQGSTGNTTNPPTPPTPPLPGQGGFIGGVFGNQGSNQGSTGVVTPGSSGTILGGMTSIPRPNTGGFIGGILPGRPGRPIRPFPPINVKPSRQTVPYHTHTMEHNGWTKETGGPTNMRRGYGRPRPGGFIGGGFIGRPRPIPTPRPVTTIKPGMNIPAAPLMRNASGCGAGYSNASGDNCGLWMCATGH